MQPTYADFTGEPTLLSPNATLETDRCVRRGNRMSVNAGGSLTLAFRDDQDPVQPEATVTLRALVAKHGRDIGYAPVSVYVNGEAVIRDWTVPGGGDLPQDNVFAVPGGCLDWRQGRTEETHTLRVRTAPDSSSYLWVFGLTVDSTFERGRSRDALAAARVRDDVVVYRISTRRVGEDRWREEGDIEVYLRRAEPAELTNLSWRHADGTCYSVAFTGGDFRGYRHTPAAAPEEAVVECHGREAARRPPDAGGTGAPRVRRYDTRQDWHLGWHHFGELAFGVGPQDTPLTALSWRDSAHNAASLQFSDSAGRRFIGYYHRANEGAIGYEGRLRDP